METKPIYASKTFWFNILSVLSAIIALTDPALLGISTKWLLFASGIINILLRFITTGAVSLTGSANSQPQ